MQSNQALPVTHRQEDHTLLLVAVLVLRLGRKVQVVGSGTRVTKKTEQLGNS